MSITNDAQIATLNAFILGKIQVKRLPDGQPEIIGPSGRALRFDYGNGYPRITLTNTGDDRRRRNIPVHAVCLLWERWINSTKGCNIEDLIIKEDEEIDHLDGDPHNCLIENLKAVPIKENQANKSNRRKPLNPDQIKAIKQILENFPDINRRALASVLKISPTQVE